MHKPKMRKSRHKSKSKRRNPSRGWKNSAPKNRSARRSLRGRCGSRAFLLPKELKFPIMSSRGSCKVSCAGLLSAYRRSRQYKYARVSRKALAATKRARCKWFLQK